MTNPSSRRSLLQAALAVSTTLVLPRSKACEYFAPTLRVVHPWTRATPAGAEFALLGMRFDDVLEDELLLEVQTPVAQIVVFVPGSAATGANGEIAGVALPLAIPAGRETVLGQLGATSPVPHLRLLRLTQDLEIGRSYPLLLKFQKGGTVKAQLNVDYARFA